MVRISLLAILVACHAPRAKPAAPAVVAQQAPPHHTPSRSDPVPEQRAFVEVLRDPCGLAPHHDPQLAEVIRTGQCVEPKSPKPIVVVRPAGEVLNEPP